MIAASVRCNMVGPMQPASPFRLALGGLFAIAAAMGIGRFVYTPILPSMMAELGLTAREAGLIASANYLGYFAGAIAAAGGWAAGRERAVMIIALAGSAALAAAMAGVDSMPAFMLIRFLAGFASAFAMIFTTAIVFGHLGVAGRDDLQGLQFAGVGLGIAGSAVMTALLHGEGAAWTAPWIWSGVLSALALVLTAILVDRGPPGTGRRTMEPPLRLDSRLSAIVIAYGLFGFGYIVTATFLVAIVRQNGSGPLLESAVWLVTGIAVIPSVHLWSLLGRRIGLPRTFALSCVVEAVGVVASVLLGGTIGPLLGGLLLGATFIAITAIGLQLGRLAVPRSPRRILSFMTVSFSIGQIAGPALAGLLAQAAGGYLLPSLAAALALVIAAILVARIA